MISMGVKMEILPLPVIITREGKWFVAYCPPLDLATRGKTEKEVKGNMKDLIDDYLSDPDTPKPKLGPCKKPGDVSSF
jgi:predicted RNase H-like HicB family nuclease